MPKIFKFKHQQRFEKIVNKGKNRLSSVLKTGVRLMTSKPASIMFSTRTYHMTIKATKNWCRLNYYTVKNGLLILAASISLTEKFELANIFGNIKNSSYSSSLSSNVS